MPLNRTRLAQIALRSRKSPGSWALGVRGAAPGTWPSSFSAHAARFSVAAATTTQSTAPKPPPNPKVPHWITLTALGVAAGVAYISATTDSEINKQREEAVKAKAREYIEQQAKAAEKKGSSDSSSGGSPPPLVPSAGAKEARRYPIISREEVKHHTDFSTGIWATYQGGVYDITDFIRGHPGGFDRIMMAAGNDVEPFWKVYQQHYRGHIIDWMEKFRIGTLTPEDAEAQRKEFVFPDPYAEDPPRHPDHLGCTLKPWCGEPRLELLADNYYTPNHLFYVRNHLPVPDIDAEDYELEIEGNGVKPTVLTLEDIKTKFKKYDVVCTLQCAGNRREDFHGIAEHQKHIFISPHWVSGAISNAKWSGARLRDVLDYCGLDVDAMALGKQDPGAQHIQFEGYDSTEGGENYGGSIPIDRAIDPYGDCLVAYEMNGEPLPRDHGFPVRAISPGMAGARNCKWLAKIIVSDQDSQKHWQQKAYRGFAPDISFEENLSKWGLPDSGIRLEQAPIVLEMPVQSLVCRPAANMVMGVKEGVPKTIKVKGVAWSGGGRGIHRVDVSIDGGKTLTAAELIKPIKQGRMQQWGWFIFEKELPLPQDVVDRLKRGERVQLDVTSKAVNGNFDVQPEKPDMYYNARGVCINHMYHSIVTLDPKEQVDTYPQGDARHFSNVPTCGQYLEPWKGHGWQEERTDSEEEKKA